MGKSNQGHWVGAKADPHNHFGFVYKITDLKHGRCYIGKKQYWMKKRIKGCSSAVADPTDSRWKPKCWKESDWRTYTGSSKRFNKYIAEVGKENFKFEILYQARTRGLLTYLEVQAMIDNRVLTVHVSEEERMFFNRRVPAIKFVPKFTKEEADRLDLLKTRRSKCQQ